MLNYTLRRIAIALPTIFIIATAAFFGYFYCQFGRETAGGHLAVGTHRRVENQAVYVAQRSGAHHELQPVHEGEHLHAPGVLQFEADQRAVKAFREQAAHGLERHLLLGQPLQEEGDGVRLLVGEAELGHAQAIVELRHVAAVERQERHHVEHSDEHVDCREQQQHAFQAFFATDLAAHLAGADYRARARERVGRLARQILGDVQRVEHGEIGRAHV